MSLLLLLTGGSAAAPAGPSYPPSSLTYSTATIGRTHSLSQLASRLEGAGAAFGPVSDEHVWQRIRTLYAGLSLHSDNTRNLQVLIHHLTGQRELGPASREYLIGVLHASLDASGYPVES